ncbi:chemotaxis protein [Psychromonas antarctica]|jgi:two-component system chemotaxis response regulator CheV|uniref:chemotaxis protein n=1 Tax=Psychromonas antarctica TaxID=67573 RepID=UPI001EE8C531|nr:chemotaxis protein [Psychromonas antarctica]MCG6202278.1 chemotaxis protein [Psychromonas antarctica]
MQSTSSQSQGLLLFKLSQLQTFALGTLKIQEIVPYQPLTKLPNSEANVIGAACIRGQTLTIIDMAAAVGYPPISQEEKKDCVIIITDCSRMHVGFLVRKIERIIECNWKKIEPPPTSLGNRTYITGITYFENKLIQLFDIELLLSEIFPSENDKVVEITGVQKGLLQNSHILLVDDSAVARKQLEHALTNIDVPFKVCKNGNDALAVMKECAAKDNPIDILVSDIEMPGLDGYELTFEVRSVAEIAHAYIILHTSLSSEMSVDRANQVGADDALTKFEAQALVNAMLKGAEKHHK